jgi:acetyltransferase-like isoleucine patch superfamily enzyme
MMNTEDGLPRRLTIAWRIVWTIGTLTVAEVVICGVSALPAVAIWSYLVTITASIPIARFIVFSAAIVPSYMLFALCVTIVSPVAIRSLRWHTPPDREMRIAEMGWPLLRWVRYAASIHVARVLAGTFFRGSPIWTLHLRLNGARLGTQVYVNSLSVSDYNLLECGDDVVIGGAVQLSGHTVEEGVVKTARIRIGDHVTIGLGSVVEIGAEIGSNCQIGALSFVPKYNRLPGDAVYAGSPVKRIEHTVSDRPPRIAAARSIRRSH